MGGLEEVSTFHNMHARSNLVHMVLLTLPGVALALGVLHCAPHDPFPRSHTT